jgi:hypothetical protein
MKATKSSSRKRKRPHLMPSVWAGIPGAEVEIMRALAYSASLDDRATNLNFHRRSDEVQLSIAA